MKFACNLLLLQIDGLENDCQKTRGTVGVHSKGRMLGVSQVSKLEQRRSHLSALTTLHETAHFSLNQHSGFPAKHRPTPEIHYGG